jgi:hypothetical protein
VKLFTKSRFFTKAICGLTPQKVANRPTIPVRRFEGIRYYARQSSANQHTASRFDIGPAPRYLFDPSGLTWTTQEGSPSGALKHDQKLQPLARWMQSASRAASSATPERKDELILDSHGSPKK